MALLLALLAAAVPSAAVARDSVYEVHAATDGAAIVAGVAASLVPIAFANQLVTQRCPCDPLEVNAFDRHVIGNHSDAADSASTLTAAAAAVVPAAADVLALGFRRALLEDAVVFSEVLAVNQGVNTVVKYAVHRPRPPLYAGNVGYAQSNDGYTSFYSGHTAFTFAALSAAAYTLDARWSQGIWPWLVTAAVGTSVAAERVAAGRHFYTDVIAAAGIGTLFGVAIPWLHERGQSIAVAPSQVSLSLRY